MCFLQYAKAVSFSRNAELAYKDCSCKGVIYLHGLQRIQVTGRAGANGEIFAPPQSDLATNLTNPD
jgi:hypothetical protein